MKSVTIQELLTPYFPKDTDFKRVKIIHHVYDAWKKTGDENYIEFQKHQAKNVFKNIDYIVTTIGQAEGGSASVFKGVYSVQYSGEKDWTNPLTKIISTLHFYEMEEVTGFEKFKDKIVIDYPAPIGWNQFWEKGKIIIDGLDILEYRTERLTKIFKEFVEFSDWCYQENNGEYADKKAKSNKFIVGKFKRDDISPITVVGRHFGWSFNQPNAGKKLWAKGYINDGGKKIVYDRSEETSKKLKFEVFLGKDSDSENKNKTLKVIELGNESPTLEQITEIIKFFWEYVDMEKESLVGWNKILYGPPGTGKTYKIREIKQKLLGSSDNVREAALNYEPSSWKEAIYLAFIIKNEKTMTVKDIEKSDVIVQYANNQNSKKPYDTINTEISENATKESTGSKNLRKTDLFERVDRKYWQLTEKGRLEAEKIENKIKQLYLSKYDSFFSLVTFHQSYSYEDFIEGIVAETKDGHINYRVKDGIFKEFCNRAKDHPQQNYLFAIDEINRGNISKILGELITLIEPSKRLGAAEELTVTLPYSGETFGVPKNVFILGTMNTADRSIAMMDTALRRRFEFKEERPDPSIIGSKVGTIGGIDVAKLMEVMNSRIEFLYDRDHTLGHAFFLNISTIEELQSVFEKKIIPLLQEYFFEDYEKIRAVLNDEKGIYIERIDKLDDNLFGSKFKKLTNDYDNVRFVVNHGVQNDDFIEFAKSIVADGKSS
ncbi:AAA family ATPase [Enterococcus sp. 669A]|uniref:AAA family ATPase n=1 Tax=Candidatus Enterococcus moelleringii TaxID=2815325 RepID=A0ABS3LFI1_9ENTE|nr:AAA family ATPase [Enterococcus sp. 669A]MBO1307815.1 AAA family ATPase [Enterococcus sp. 669A]